jgi:hypothetical protein
MFGSSPLGLQRPRRGARRLHEVRAAQASRSILPSSRDAWRDRAARAAVVVMASWAPRWRRLREQRDLAAAEAIGVKRRHAVLMVTNDRPTAANERRSPHSFSPMTGCWRISTRRR